MASVTISPPTAADRQPFLEAVARSKSLHGEWVSPPDTPAAFDKYLERSAQSDRASFLLRLCPDGELAGAANLSNIIGEPLCSAFLGFYTFEPHARQGHMKAGLRLVLESAFTDVALHRVEANIQPTNLASIAVVRALGFRREGFSSQYLHIAGQWRDHERWAILADEFRPQR